MYGVSYAYLVHHLANILSAWLVGIHFTDSNFSLRRIWRMLDSDDFSSSLSEPGGSHIKKEP